MPTKAWAGGISFDCSFETWPGGSRSKIKITGNRLPKGKYFAIVLSGDGVKKKSKPKATSGRKQIEFEFDSDLEDVVSEGKTQVDPHFTRSLRATAAIFVAGSNRKVADTFRYRPCKKIEDDGNNGSPPPPEPPPPPCRPDDNPSPGDPNDCSGGGPGSGGGGRNRDPGNQ